MPIGKSYKGGKDAPVTGPKNAGPGKSNLGQTGSTVESKIVKKSQKKG